jgi:hypothetical protein
VGYDDEVKVTNQRTEARFIAASVSIAGALGYLWLSNTWVELQRMRDELVAYRNSVEQTYAQKELVRLLDERQTRVERRVEERLEGIETFHQNMLNHPASIAPGKGKMQ